MESVIENTKPNTNLVIKDPELANLQVDD